MNTSITTRLLCATFAVLTSTWLLDTVSSAAHSQKAAAILAAAAAATPAPAPVVAQWSER